VLTLDGGRRPGVHVLLRAADELGQLACRGVRRRGS